VEFWTYGGLTEKTEMKMKIGSELIGSGKLLPKEKPYEVYDTKLRGFMIRIQPSGKMAYYFSYRLSNHQRNRVKIAPVDQLTPAQARVKAEELYAKVINGVDPASYKRESRISARTTVGKFLEEEYRPWVETTLRSGKGNVSRIKSRYPDFLNKPISDNNFRWLVEKLRLERQKAGLKKATIDRDVATLKAFFSFAKERGAIPLNPLSGLKALRRADHDDEDDKRVRYLGQFDENEEVRFWAAIESREERKREERRTANEWRRERRLGEYPSLDAVGFTDYLKPMILVALHTGVRRKELFGLEWSNINFHSSEPTLTIPGRIAKNKKTRHVPLNRTSLKTLRDWKSQSQDCSGLIFPSKNGAIKTDIKKAWGGIVTEAHLINFRWHDMRHDFASKLVMNDVELNTVRELLGHKEMTVTLRYAHLKPKKLADAVASLCEEDQSPIGRGVQSIVDIHRPLRNGENEISASH